MLKIILLGQIEVLAASCQVPHTGQCCKQQSGEMSEQVNGIDHLNHCVGSCCLAALTCTTGNILSPTDNNSEKQQDRIPGKFIQLIMYLQDFLSFLNQKKTPLALEKMFLRKMKCMKSEFNLGSAPSLAPVFQKLLFDGPTNCKGTEKGAYAPRVRASTGHFVVKYCKSQGWIQTSQWKYSHQVH